MALDGVDVPQQSIYTVTGGGLLFSSRLYTWRRIEDAVVFMRPTAIDRIKGDTTAGSAMDDVFEDGECIDEEPPPGRRMTDESRAKLEACLEEARRALQALREPTQPAVHMCLARAGNCLAKTMPGSRDAVFRVMDDVAATVAQHHEAAVGSVRMQLENVVKTMTAALND